jgi:nucleotide-binding universal stress UspA family protein
MIRPGNENNSVAWAPEIELNIRRPVTRKYTAHNASNRVGKMPRLAGSSRAGDGKQVRAQPRNKTPAAQFRSRDVQREESVAGLTSINAYESADLDNTIFETSRRHGSISMIKDIIVHLEHQAARDPACDFAVTIAEIFDAHLAAVAFAYAPDFPRSVMLEIPADIVARMIAESEKAALAAIERFDAGAKRSLISAEHRLLKLVGASAPAVLSTLARRFDLGVFMQSEPNGVDNDDMIEVSLFESGRPLIVVPYSQKDGLKLDHVVCCWDGSRAATRAFNDGLPLLVKATTVDLLVVLNEKTDTSPNEIRGAEMAKHLARHDVNVQIVTVQAADIDVTNAILSYVADVSGTLIVMGGYGHAKLREVILGGVTRDMFKSMTVPVFMSH